MKTTPTKVPIGHFTGRSIRVGRRVVGRLPSCQPHALMNPARVWNCSMMAALVAVHDTGHTDGSHLQSVVSTPCQCLQVTNQQQLQVTSRPPIEKGANVLPHTDGRCTETQNSIPAKGHSRDQKQLWILWPKRPLWSEDGQVGPEHRRMPKTAW